MAISSSTSVTGVGTSTWIPVNSSQANFKVSLFTGVTGTATYTIQHTPDNVMDASVTPVAYNHDILAGLTSGNDGNYAYPVRAVRINLTSGTGTVTLKVLQGD